MEKGRGRGKISVLLSVDLRILFALLRRGVRLNICLRDTKKRENFSFLFNYAVVTNYRGIDAPRSAERGVLMTSRHSSGEEDRFTRCVYIYNLGGPDAPSIRGNMDDSKFESCARMH